MEPLTQINITSSQSNSSVPPIDLASAGTRAKKTFLYKELQKLLEQGDYEQVRQTIQHKYSLYFTAEQLDAELKKVTNARNSQLKTMSINNQSLSGQHSQILQNQKQLKLPLPTCSTPVPKPPKNPITNFVKVVKPDASYLDQINILKQQVAEYKERSLSLEQQLRENQLEQSSQLYINKVRMALKIHEAEVQQIEKLYQESKLDERMRFGQENTTLREHLLAAEIEQISAQISLLDVQINDAKFAKYTLILEYNNLLQKRTQLLAQMEQFAQNHELSTMIRRRFTFLKERNQFQQLLLPNFYPPPAFGNVVPRISSQSFVAPHNKPPFLLLRMLGEGGFSKVFKAFNTKTCEFVALKISSLQDSSADKWRLVQREAQIYQKLKHQNIVKLHSQFEVGSGAETQIAIEMELCDDQSLFDFICIQTHRVMSQREREINEKIICGIFLQVADAIKYLHDQKLTHNDISLNNILQKGALWKLSDFSLVKSVICNSQEQKVTTLGLTRPFAPPEKVIDKMFSPASDIYSLGVVMFVCLTGQIKTFEEIGKKYQNKTKEAAQEVVKDHFNSHPTQVCTASEELRLLIQQMVDIDLKKRPTINQIIDALEKMLKKTVKRAKADKKE